MMMTQGELKTLVPHPIKAELESFKGRHPKIRPVFSRKDLDYAKVRFECYSPAGKPIGQRLNFDVAVKFVDNYKDDR